MKEGYIQKPVIIADNAATSSAVDITGYRLIGVAIPAMTWVAADLTPEIDPDGSGTYYPVEANDGTFVRIQDIAAGANAARMHTLPNTAEKLAGINARIRSVNVGSEADVNQTNGPLTFILMLEAIS